jgi:cytochrome c-type biogenesis protein CcmH/NrfF
MPARIKNDMRVWLICAATLLLACNLFVLPAARAQETAHAKQLGMKLMCMCGCGQVLVECNHINCPSSAPMLKELDSRLRAGEPDDLVVQDFIQEYGVAVLSSPPNTGFNRIAWLLPGGAFAIGLAIVTLVILHWRRRTATPAARPGPPIRVSPDVLARAREQVDRETED